MGSVVLEPLRLFLRIISIRSHIWGIISARRVPISEVQSSVLSLGELPGLLRYDHSESLSSSKQMSGMMSLSQSHMRSSSPMILQNLSGHMERILLVSPLLVKQRLSPTGEEIVSFALLDLGQIHSLFFQSHQVEQVSQDIVCRYFLSEG